MTQHFLMKFVIMIYLLVQSLTALAQTQEILYLDENLAIVKKSKAAYKGLGASIGENC